MKKILSLYLSLFVFVIAKANEVGHFFVDLSSQNVSVANISTSFSSYVNVASGSTFTLFRDTTDGLGIRHQSYQQYVQGTKVQSHMILVHSKNGKVENINGAVMPNSALPQSSSAKISRKQAAQKAPSQIADSSVTMIFYCLDGVFYKVYKVPSPETFETLYIDVASGDILYRESAFRNADVIGRGYTRYNGWQDMTVYENDGKYFLLDEGRKIITKSAESGSPNTSYYTSESYLAENLPEDVISMISSGNYTEEELSQIQKQYIWSPMMTDYILNTCTNLYSEDPDMYISRIQSITISTAASSWWYDIWDTKPDLYCQICDANGNVLYTTNTKEDCTLPITFTFSKGIVVTKGSIVKIYDEDASTDSYGGGVTLTSVSPGTKTWSNSNTSGSIVIIDSPVEYADIHWGMQKTIDFYQETFNRNSFDGKDHMVINLAFPPYDKQVFPTMPNNAAAQSDYEPYFMFYGWGDGVNMNPVVSLDVMAHEFTHMVTGTNGNGGLEYKLESGALNESFSDIMAMGVMQYTFGNCPWTIGAEVMVNAPNMRSMSNPKNSKGANGDTLKGALPDTYKGTCWSYIPATIDTNKVVVHRNIGVQNYWFYLLSEGGFGTNDNNDSYSVAGIGMDKALQIAFRNLLFYLVPCSTFEDSRNGSIQAAIDLYGRDSQEHQSVMNAWHAVGVGNRYVEPSEDFQLKPGKYVIVANRNKTGDKNWYYMTSDLGTASTKRFQAVSSGTESMDAIAITDLEDKYVWTLEADGSNWKLKNGTQYVTWTSGNSANLGTTAKSLTFDVAENQVQAHFNDGTAERYLSLNAATNNNYFAFYGNTNQITHLYFLPYDDGTTPPPPVRDCKSVPYTETFAASQGDFTVINLTLPSSFTSIWNWDSQYGMVAKCIKNNTKYESESWLISPCIELPATESCVVSFSHAAKFFENTSQMSMWISTDFDESAPDDAQWTRLVIPTYPTGANWNWFESGDIDLFEYKGQYINIAFRYTSTSSYAPQWEIKNFAIRKQSTTGIDGIYSNKPSAIKILRNGQIYIIRGDKTYTLQGQEVK